MTPPSSNSDRLPDAWQRRVKRADGRWGPWCHCRGYPIDEPREIQVDGKTYQYRPLYAEEERN